jgi:hypothetical protein
METENHFLAERHKARCPLCHSPNKERNESDLRIGGDVSQIQRALNAEMGKKTGVSRRAILRHKELLPYLVPSKSRADAGPNAEFSHQEVLTLPLSQLQERFKNSLLETSLDILSAVRRGVTNASEETALYELVDSIRGLVNISLVLLDKPSFGAAAAKGSVPTFQEIVDRITDPADRAAYISTQRDLSRDMREAIKIVKKYEEPSAETSAGAEDKTVRNEAST